MIPARASGAIVDHSMKAMTTASEHTNTFPTRFERVTTSNAGCTSPGSGSEPGSAAGGGSSEEVDAVERSDPPAVLLAGSGVEEFSVVIVVSGLTTASAGMSVGRGGRVVEQAEESAPRTGTFEEPCSDESMRLEANLHMDSALRRRV